ncbi:ABC-type transport system, permease component [Melioribacter roseus P3M-2]|uniref:ABC-type transport system, permease component n=1 Tax=Melioribacter roseus (strain DSM 23840 / JCM 17771 / VKM B-2668 / P3M-2) TaxID=1191523 RepID=I6Z6Y0_MELRP|nr:ABC transporter permease [Melioribacter roseus]AFN74900.1 ABC-type transport system, permease component [Melioribacter roseus P3M-2]
MILKIAWRNLWRNKRRSIIIQSSVVVGVAAIILLDSLSNGMLVQMLNNQINTSVAHIQIHKNGFKDNKLVKNFIGEPEKVKSVIDRNSHVKAYSERVISFGLISSASNSSGVYINGIDPDRESKVSIMNAFIKKGNYITSKGNDDKMLREIVIGEKLADKLNVDIGDKVVLLSNTPDGSIGSDLFRVSGIFKTFSSEIDNSLVYIPLKSAQGLLDIGDNIHEIALILDDYKLADNVKDDIRKNLNDDYEVLSYSDNLPLLVIQLDFYKQSAYIITVIVSIALIFGIINTMLMAVMERIREFGVLKSIGMKNSKLFFMILTEAFILGVSGTIIGALLAVLTYLPLSHTGIDFSIFAASLESFGVGAIIYPVLLLENVINTLLTIPLVAALGAIYPAYRAIKLEPVYALRYI